MTNPLLPVYVRAQMFVATRREQLRSRLTDRGAGLVEYGALIVLAVAILSAIYASGITTTISQKLEENLGKLFTPKNPG
ncbi:Flp family type IVb pilin [Nocardiopsis rhodophaea]